MTDSLAGPIFWVAVAICAVAQVALLHAFFLGAARVPASAAGRFRATETLWALLPALALMALFGASWQAMQPGSEQELRSSSHGSVIQATVSVAPAGEGGR